MKINRLTPMLPVKSMPASVAFYQKLGFQVERRNDDWGWAMLRCDECRLMVDQSINDVRTHPVNPWSTCTPQTLWSITSRCATTASLFPT